MYNRQDVFNKYYKSDIFNLNQSDSKARKTKGVIRPNFPTLESTKEDLFNVGKKEEFKGMAGIEMNIQTSLKIGQE